MDSRKDITMTIAKYTAYIGMIVAIIFEKKSDFVLSTTLCSLLIAIGSIRQFIVEDQYNFLKKYTFIIDFILMTALWYLDNRAVYAIGYYILLVEGVFICPYLYGAILSLACYLSYSVIWLKFNYSYSTREIVLSLLYTSLAFLFCYTISFSGKRQIEQKKKLEFTVDKLEKSKLELETAYEKLIISNKKIQEFAIVEERNRMAREIHDTLAHTLTTIIVEIEAGKRIIRKGTEGALVELDKAQNQARFGLEEVRHSIKNLRSGVLSSEGFLGALKITLDQLRSMGQINITLNVDEEININEDYEMALFRIIQEASTNSFRHGKSKNIYITLRNSGAKIKLSIVDDGIGCEDIKPGYGIVGIRERVKKLGGQTIVESTLGKGFKVDVTLPLEGAS